MSELDGSTMSSVDQVLAGGGKVFPHLRWCGVYFLCIDDRVMYVGQSTDVSARIASHYRKKPHFSSALLIRCAQKDRHRIEEEWIDRLKPEWNSNGPTGKVRHRRKWLRKKHNYPPHRPNGQRKNPILIKIPENPLAVSLMSVTSCD